MRKFVGFVLAGSLLSACGGSSTTALPGAGGASAATPATNSRGTVTFKLVVPPHAQSASVARKPLYVSPSMQSLVVTLTAQNGTTVAMPQPYAASFGSAACPVVAGSPTCSLSVPAPVGTDTFTIATYDAPQTSATPTVLAGNVLSTASTMTTVVANTSNSVTLTLNGVFASLSLTLANAAPPTGTPATIGLGVTARDVDGNVIVGPGSYTVPITLTDSDTSGATTLSTTTVTGPSTVVTIAYTGAPTTATFSASAPNHATVTSPSLVTQISRILVSDDEFENVASFTTNGTATTPTYSTGLVIPQGVAVDRAGNVYVTDQQNQKVRKYSGAGTLLMTMSGFPQPEGVAVDPAGKIYIVDPAASSIKTFNADGTPTTPTITGLLEPEAVALDSSGNIYVTESANNDVLKYSPTGTKLLTITAGLSTPYGVAVDGAGKIYVTNKVGGVGNLTTYTPAGVQTTPTITADINSPYGVAVDPAGKIYVANASAVTIYAADGAEEQTTITSPNYQPVGVALY